MSDAWQDPAAVSFMLDECTTWAVVGLSGHTDRTVYRIATLLQERGKRIVPIHPAFPVVLGEQGFPTLGMRCSRSTSSMCSAARRTRFRSRIRPLRSARRVSGFSSASVDEAAFARTRAAGIPMVMDICPAIQWRKRERSRKQEVR